MEKNIKYRKKIYEQIKKTGKRPQWVLNEIEYAKKYYSGMGYKSIQVSLNKTDKDILDKVLSENNITKEQFIQNIVNKYL
jgi:hypothetical protein